MEWIIVRDNLEDEEVMMYCLLNKSPYSFQYTPDGPPHYLTVDQFAFTGLLVALGRDQESMSAWYCHVATPTKSRLHPHGEPP